MPQKIIYCSFCQGKRFRYRHNIDVKNVSKLAPVFQLTNDEFERLFSFNIIECKDCGLLLTDRVLTSSETNKFYNYRTYKDKKFTETYEKYYNSLLHFINAFKTIQGKKFVEIGSGYGFLLNLARKRGAIPIGFEIDKNLVDYAKNKFNLQIINEDFLNYNHPYENFYDIIILSAVIEHLTNPIEYLKRIYALLKPRGVFYFDIPETCFFTKYILRHRYYGYVLGHYIFPSKKLINQKLNEIGFTILTFKTVKLTLNRIFNFIPKLVKNKVKKTQIPIERDLPDEFYESHGKKSLQQLKFLPLLPLSLGYSRILCQK